MSGDNMTATCLQCSCRPRRDDNACHWAHRHNAQTGHVVQVLETQGRIYA